MFLALRCFTFDVIASYCFARPVDALGEPDFKSPIIKAMDASLPTHVIFKHFSIVRKAFFEMPVWLTVRLWPKTAGFLNFKQILIRQINEVGRSPASLRDAPSQTIYRQLLSKEATKGSIPLQGSINEEAQALVFNAVDTTANVLMLGIFHVLEDASIYKNLKDELRGKWPNLQKTPKFEYLEELPFLVSNSLLRLRTS